MPSPSSALALVRERVISCHRCQRLREYCGRVGEVKKAAYRDDIYWARPVPGFGDSNARVLVIGLAPAAHGANRTGRVFTGDGALGSGDFLMRAMHAHGFASQPTSERKDDGLRLTDAYITMAARCAPPDNKPTSAEIAACHDHLVSEFTALSRVSVIVCLGRIAYDAALATPRFVRRADQSASAVRAWRSASLGRRICSHRVLSSVAAEHEHRPVDARDVE